MKRLQDEDVDYKKRYTLSEKNKSFEKEYKSAKDVFKEFSPRQWRNQINYIKNLTPEEYETVLGCFDYFKRNSVAYSGLFLTLA